MKNIARQLYEAVNRLGTDEKTFLQIIDSENLSDDDWVKIIQEYESIGDNTNFIKDVDLDFSGEQQDYIQEQLALKLVKAAQNGNSDAIDVLCKEFYNATSNMQGTADEFIAGIMDNAGPEVISKMLDRYTIVTGQDMINDVKKDFSFGTQTNYIQKIIDAILVDDE